MFPSPPSHPTLSVSRSFLKRYLAFEDYSDINSNTRNHRDGYHFGLATYTSGANLPLPLDQHYTLSISLMGVMILGHPNY